MIKFWKRINSGEASDREMWSVTVAVLAVALTLFVLPSIFGLQDELYRFLSNFAGWLYDGKQYIYHQFAM